MESSIKPNPGCFSFEKTAEALRDIEATLGVDEANSVLANAIHSSSPMFIGRLGSTEYRSVLRSAATSSNLHDRLIFAKRKFGIPAYVSWQEIKLHRKSGFFPIHRESVHLFASTYVSAMKDIGLLGSWVPGENAFKCWRNDLRVTSLRHLEPFRARVPWTHALEGKKVLVVTPFAESVREQYAHRSSIFFEGREILPTFHLQTYKAVQSLAGETVPFDSWFDALEKMAVKIESMSFDVAILGCGSYGLPLGARIYRTGRIAVVMGGVTQLLFGIRGRRWDHHPDYSGSFSGAWRYPKESERPREIRWADKGAYW